MDPSEVMVFRARAPPQGQCENLVCAVNLVANLQTGGHYVVDTIFEVVQEQKRWKIANELRKFNEVDNHVAVKIGDLEAITVVKPQFSEGCPEAAASRKVFACFGDVTSVSSQVCRSHHQGPISCSTVAVKSR